MKNKLLSVLLVVFMVAMSLVALVGCTVTYVSIRIDDTAMKTDYVKGEALSYEGLKVYATTDKGEEVELTAEQYTLSVEAGTTVDKKLTITVALVDNPEISEKITVKSHNDIVSAEIKTHATKLEYLVGERFDATGLVVTVTRENGEKEDVTSGFTYKTEPLTTADTTIEITVGAQKVTETLTIIRGVFIEAEDGRINSTEADINSDSPEATGGLYVGDMKSGDTLTFLFSADKAGTAAITFRLASQYLKADSNWTPIWMGDCQLNKIMKVYVNGVEQVIADDVILPGGGGPDGEPDASLWFNWRDVVFGSAQLVEGVNEIQIEFIPHEYTDCSQSSFNGKFTANIDSMKVTTSDINVSASKVELTELSLELDEIKLEERNGAACFVITGGSYAASVSGIPADQEAEAIASAIQKKFYFDVQSDPNEGGNSSWALHLTNTHRVVLLEDGKFEIVADLSSMGADALIVHFVGANEDGSFPTGGGTDFKPEVDTFSAELTVGNTTYEMVYDKDRFFGCVGIFITVNA